MTNTQIINNLWQEMREYINKSYAVAANDDDLTCLREYAENISWSDDLQKLLDTETANERQHRSNRPQVVGFSAGTAAKLILMHNVADGSLLKAMPKATTFLVLRKTAAEAQLIGYLSRHAIEMPWIKAVRSFDYAKMMQAA